MLFSFDKAESDEIRKSMDDTVVNAENDIPLSHSCQIRLTLFPDEAYLRLFPDRNECHAELFVVHIDGVVALIIIR